MTQIHKNRSGMRVVSLQEKHLAPILSLMNKEGWYYYDRYELQRYLNLDQACFVLVRGQAVLGSLFTTNYGNQAWIGNIIVAQEERGKGFASKLMTHAMDHLNKTKQVETFRLGSVPLAIGVYKRAGFRAEAFTSAQEADLPLKTLPGIPSLDKGLEIDRIRVEDMEAIAGIDQIFFKSNRLPLLNRLFHDAIPSASLCLRNKGKIVGFLMIRKRQASKSKAGFGHGPDHAYRLGPSSILPTYGTTGFKALLYRAIPQINKDAAHCRGNAKIYVVFPKNAEKDDIYKETRELADTMGMGKMMDLDQIFDHHETIFNAPGSEKNKAQERLMQELGFHQEYFEQVMVHSIKKGERPANDYRETRADSEGIFASATPGDKA